MDVDRLQIVSPKLSRWAYPLEIFMYPRIPWFGKN